MVYPHWLINYISWFHEKWDAGLGISSWLKANWPCAGKPQHWDTMRTVRKLWHQILYGIQSRIGSPICTHNRCNHVHKVKPCFSSTLLPLECSKQRLSDRRIENKSSFCCLMYWKKLQYVTLQMKMFPNIAHVLWTELQIGRYTISVLKSCLLVLIVVAPFLLKKGVKLLFPTWTIFNEHWFSSFEFLFHKNTYFPSSNKLFI